MQEKSNEIINLIDEKVKVKHDVSNTIIHFMEELGEMFKEIGRGSYRHEGVNKEELSSEIADVLIFLMKIADNYDIDVEKAFVEKANKLKEKWNLDGD